MKKLEIIGDRQTGKTQALVNHLADFVSDNPEAKVLVWTPNVSQRDVIISYMRKKMRCSEISRIDFAGPRTLFRGYKYDAAYVDGAENNIEKTIYQLTQPESVMVITKEIKNGS